MKSFLSSFLRRLTCWWVPIAAPWCALFLGLGTPDEIEIWFNELTFRRFYRSMAAGFLFALPIALVAALAHTVALYRDRIFFADVRARSPGTAGSDTSRNRSMSATGVEARS